MDAVAEKPVEAEVKGKPAETRPEDKPADTSADKPAVDPAAKPAASPDTPDKPADKKPDGTSSATSGDTADAAASKVPDKYTLTVPEGSRVDDEDRAQVEQMAKTAGWSNDEAQAALEELHTQLDAQATRWLTQTQADRDYGGEHLEQSQRFAKLAIDRLRPAGHPRRESFLRFLNKGGAGNHLEVVAFLADLGKAMGEDSPAAGISGGKPAGFDPAGFFNHPSSAKYRKP